MKNVILSNLILTQIIAMQNKLVLYLDSSTE